jgi:hypothetical protein
MRVPIQGLGPVSSRRTEVQITEAARDAKAKAYGQEVPSASQDSIYEFTAIGCQDEKEILLGKWICHRNTLATASKEPPAATIHGNLNLGWNQCRINSTSAVRARMMTGRKISINAGIVTETIRLFWCCKVKCTHISNRSFSDASLFIDR